VPLNARQGEIINFNLVANVVTISSHNSLDSCHDTPPVIVFNHNSTFVATRLQNEKNLAD
jgi:hypothetical protein